MPLSVLYKFLDSPDERRRVIVEYRGVEKGGGVGWVGCKFYTFPK